jgi:hypothetical protein
MEAVDNNSKLLLIDEDRSATNFMIRDCKMKRLIEKEPIIPFTDRINELYRAKGVSKIIVIGGSGEYLSVADKIYMMEDYLINDVTEKAKKICGARGTNVASLQSSNWMQRRILLADNFSSYPKGSGKEKLVVSYTGFISIGDEMIDIRGLNNIVSNGQINALGYMLRYLEAHNSNRIIPLSNRINELFDMIEEEGLDSVFSNYFTTTERFMDLPRKCELKAVINRMRGITIKTGDVINGDYKKNGKDRNISYQITV